MSDPNISPNMNLPVPVVSTTPGPDWATDITACMSGIDSHDHSPGKGVQITPSGLNINADLPLNGNNLTTVNAEQFNSLAAAITSLLRSLQVVGADLYFVDGNGNSVRITQSGSVTGSSGTITGLPSGTASASYAAGTFTFQGATNTPASMNVGPIITGSATLNAKTVTIQASSSLGANYTLTLPLAQGAANSTLSNDGSGNLVFTDIATILTGELGYTWVFPATQGAANSILSNNGSGTLSFSSIGSILAAAGIGSSLSASVSNAAISGSGYSNLTSLSLTAGTWLVSAAVQYVNGSGVTSNTWLDSAISTTTASNSGSTFSATRFRSAIAAQSMGATVFPGYIQTVGSTTTYYLNARFDAASGPNEIVDATMTAVRIA